MVRKCIAEVAVLEVAQVGVMTAPTAEAMASATSTLAKKRKLNNEDLTLSSSCIDLTNRKITITSKTASESQYSSPSLDHDHVSTSCCSSNGSSEEVSERTKFADLEVKLNSEMDLFNSVLYLFVYLNSQILRFCPALMADIYFNINFVFKF